MKLLDPFLQISKSKLKPRLHYNDLVQRSLGVWIYFIVRWHTLVHVERLKVVFSSLKKTHAYVVVRTKLRRFFCIKAQSFDKCRRTAHTQMARSLNTMRTVRSSAIQHRLVNSKVVFAQPNCGIVYV